MNSFDDYAPDLHRQELASAPPKTTTPPPVTAPPATTPPARAISPANQQNHVSQYPMSNHPVAQAHFDSMRQSVELDYKNSPNVMKLSNQMGKDRVAASTNNPSATDKDMIHSLHKNDAIRQMDAGINGEITPIQATQLPASSIVPWAKSIVDRNKRPETLNQAKDAASAAAIGFSAQMRNGSVSGNQFSGSSDSLDKGGQY